MYASFEKPIVSFSIKKKRRKMIIGTNSNSILFLANIKFTFEANTGGSLNKCYRNRTTTMMGAHNTRDL